MAEEQWRPVVGYEDAYEVSNRLRVRSVARTVRRGRFQRRVRERFLAAAVQRKTGYLQVSLSCEGRQRRHYVHVLMCEAFGDAGCGGGGVGVGGYDDRDVDLYAY
ncbi:MAG TPA: NUMOD4 domain-containing protein [Mycobacterium sp.]|nr:NUMOD4 domain-containing protein [Mycobacterium sp.]